MNNKLPLEDLHFSECWAEYTKELYTYNNKYKEGTLEELGKRSAEEENCRDDIQRSEAEKTIKMLKNMKSRDNGMPVDMIKDGGSKIVHEIWEACREILETETWPDDCCKSMELQYQRNETRRNVPIIE